MPKQREDLTGRVFGRLTVIEFAGSDEGRRSLWRCSCECGQQTIVQSSNLKGGRASSCGCLRADANRSRRGIARSHGQTGTRLHRVWMRMNQRTSDPGYPGWKDYGGRGITMCPQWRNSFEQFARDMGPTYRDDLTIERIDVNGNYEPGNCRWATTKEQNRNRRDTWREALWGVEKPLVEWCELLGVNYATVRQRIRRQGWTAERAITTDAAPETLHRVRRDLSA